MRNFFDGYLQYVVGVILGILICAVFMMISGAINAYAAPVAGATAKLYEQHVRAPIAPWQQDILDVVNEEPDKPVQKEDNNVKKRSRRDQGTRGSNVDVSGSSRGRYSNHLTRSKGVFNGPSGKETYYNLPMGGCIKLMENLGFSGRYWVREDGVKMYGDYVMCAAHLGIRPKGTIINTSLGQAIVVDTGSFAQSNPYQLDIATTW